ncbi:MAG: hypothetical protein R3350_09850 [Saprospiraceae bacterium]|nr:hypothetical protein [Saprospiraceae bacterium]
MKEKKLLFLPLLMLLLLVEGHSQSYAFGFKGGLTVGFQRWDNSFDSREPLFRYHAIAFIESAPEEDEFTLFAQGGYHVKGSAIRTFSTVVQTPTGLRRVPGLDIPFEFNNLSLTVGAKQKFDFGLDSKLYYMLGVRGDYTLSTMLRPENVEEFSVYGRIFPFDEFVNKLNYGVTVGGGFQFAFSELVGGILEFTVNPDFSKQYNQPRIPNVSNPNPNSSQSLIDIPERQISNTTIEVTLGLRFLHKIVYIE